MSLAPYIHAMGRGPGRARNLTRDEARDAMAQMLSGAAAPEAVGALLMLMRYRGETGAEIAGFADALRATLPGWQGPRPALDWPSYAAGRSRGLPWFLLSAKLVARAGHPVLIHGWNSHQGSAASVRDALPRVGIAEATDMAEAERLIAREKIAYLPLDAFAPDALRLLRLREVLGLRSPVNTVLRVLNPGAATASVQGVFHPPYRELQTDAAALLGQPAMTVLKGGGGEFERHPAKEIALFGLRDGEAWQSTCPPLCDETRRLASETPDPEEMTRLWSGAAEDSFARDIVLGTAALALDTLGVADPDATAAALWHDRGALAAI